MLKTRCKKCITSVGYFLQSSEKFGPKRNFTLKITMYLLKRMLIVVLGFVHAIMNLLTYSLSFESSNIGWPQQPPTKRVLKFNIIFHDSTKIFCFLKHQSKAKFKNLDDTEVLSSDYPDLRTSEASMTSTASTTSVASMTSTASFHQKFYST